MRLTSVTRQITFDRTKVGDKYQNWKTQMRHFGSFSNTLGQLFFNGNIFVRKICCLFYGQLPEFLALQRTIKRSVNPSYFLMGVNRQESCKNFPTPIFPPVKIARHTCDCWNRHKNALFTQLLCVLLQLHHLSMKLIWENQWTMIFLR